MPFQDLDSSIVWVLVWNESSQHPMLHFCWQALEKAAQGGGGVGKAQMLCSKLSWLALPLMGQDLCTLKDLFSKLSQCLQYLKNFQHCYCHLLQAMKLFCLLKKKKNKEKSVEIKFIAIGVAGGNESVGELSATALFSCWELFLHSLGAVSVGEEKDAKGKYAEHKEYLRPHSTVYVWWATL